MSRFDSNRPYLSAGLFYGFLALLLGPFVVHEIYANDLWKSLYFSRYVSQFGVFPHQSMFSYSPVVDIVSSDVYSWLGHIVLYGIYLMGSIDALIGFRIFLVAGSLILFHSLFDYRRTGPIFLLLLLWGIGLTQKTLVRTALFAMPMAAIFWWVWDQQAEKDRDSWFVWVSLPALFIVWGNLHASYLVGLGLLGLMTTGKLLDRFNGVKRVNGMSVTGMIVLLCLCVGVAVFVKPYPDTKIVRLAKSGVNLTADSVEQFVNGDQSSSLSVRERMYHGTDADGSMMRLGGRSFSLDNLHSPYVAVALLLFSGCCFMFVAAPGSIRWTWFLPVLVTGGLAALFLRFVAYVPLVVVPATYLHYSANADSIDTDRHLPVSVICWGAALLFVVPWFYALNGSMDAVMHNPEFEFGWDTSPKFSYDMAQYVKNNHESVRVFNHYDIGGFLIWTWWPDKKVFIDSRDKAYQSRFRDAYFRESPVSLMDRYGLNYALFPLGSAWNYYVFIPSPDWQLVKYDNGMALYVRADSEVAGDIDPGEEKRALETADQSGRLTMFRRFLSRHENKPDHVGVFRSMSGD